MTSFACIVCGKPTRDGKRCRDHQLRPRAKGRPYGRVRELVLQRDRLTCQRCGLFVDDDNYEIDHIVPRSEGGTEALSNLRVVHPWCNPRGG